MSYESVRIGSLFAVLWKAATLADLERLRCEVPEAHRDAGTKLVYMSISDDQTPPPGDVERRAMVRLAEEMRPHYQVFYIVLRAEGFGGSVLRSTTAGMMLLSSHRKHVHVVGSIDEVLHRETENLGVTESQARRQLARAGMLLPRDAAADG